jgi:predicted house-cleaning noncanonical NTP pyrophosphatase (MazG superfamily)
MKKEYHKLVRDRIPEILEQKHLLYEVRTLKAHEKMPALLQKLLEEAEELRAASPEERVAELADVAEVMDALCHEFGVSWEQVCAIQEQKRRDRGGFEEGYVLEWVEE